MIYKIHGNEVGDALENGAKFLIFSSNGFYALVRSENTIVDSIETYEETNLSNLYEDPLYKQPCKDC